MPFFFLIIKDIHFFYSVFGNFEREESRGYKIEGDVREEE